MIFRSTGLDGTFVLEPEQLVDERGFFARAWCRDELEAHGLSVEIDQCNIAFNERAGTLRGLHFQRSPYLETKVVRCTAGAIYDVVVDLRPTSPTYLKWIRVELSAENRFALYVPAGLAQRGAFVDLIGPGASLDDLAASAGTIGYELLVRLGRRAHRVYEGA